MKIRIDRDLYRRAQICAEEVDVPLSEWAAYAVSWMRKGKLGCVAYSENGKCATRANSTVMTVRDGYATADEFRAAVKASVERCERIRRPAFSTSLREGVDYLVEREP